MQFVDRGRHRCHCLMVCSWNYALRVCVFAPGKNGAVCYAEQIHSKNRSNKTTKTSPQKRESSKSTANKWHMPRNISLNQQDTLTCVAFKLLQHHVAISLILCIDFLLSSVMLSSFAHGLCNDILILTMHGTYAQKRLIFERFHWLETHFEPVIEHSAKLSSPKKVYAQF